MTKKHAPLIGINLDAEDTGSFSSYPYYALRKNYFEAVSRAGGIPIGLPHLAEHIPAYLDLVDGLLLSGGDFDVDPSFYGAGTVNPAVKQKPGRAAFDMALMREALARDLPLLGICAGEQFMGALLGSTLIQNIPDEVPNAMNHHQSPRRHEEVHRVAITPGTRLHQLVGTTDLGVNTSHRQALKTVGPGLVINAVAPDGVIEGFESPSHCFVLGVQWHPEFFDGAHQALFKGFIEACRG
jgi:putative glutamine amidotransferase